MCVYILKETAKTILIQKRETILAIKRYDDAVTYTNLRKDGMFSRRAKFF